MPSEARKALRNPWRPSSPALSPFSSYLNTHQAWSHPRTFEHTVPMPGPLFPTKSAGLVPALHPKVYSCVTSKHRLNSGPSSPPPPHFSSRYQSPSDLVSFTVALCLFSVSLTAWVLPSRGPLFTVGSPVPGTVLKRGDQNSSAK